MAYTIKNFKTKKALKEAVSEYVQNQQPNETQLFAVRCFQPGIGPDLSNYTGRVCLEGPHYPEAHKWYATAELKDGVVIKVS